MRLNFLIDKVKNIISVFCEKKREREQDINRQATDSIRIKTYFY